MSRAPFNPVKPREIGTPAHCISRLFQQLGGVERAMVKLGVKKSAAYGYSDGTETMSFAQVAAVTDRVGTAGAEYLALLAGGVFLPIAPEEADVQALCADNARAHGEAVASVVEALADGRLTNGEAKAALAKIDAELRALTGLRAVIAQEARKPPA